MSIVLGIITVICCFGGIVLYADRREGAGLALSFIGLVLALVLYKVYG